MNFISYLIIWRGTYILSQKNDEIALNTIQSILILWTFESDSGSLATSAIHRYGTGENMLHGRIGTVGPGSLGILFWKAWEQRFTACSLGIERRLAVEKLVRKLIRCDQCRMQSNIITIVTRMSMA